MTGSPKAANDHVGNSTRSSDCLPMAAREYVDTHIYLIIYIYYNTIYIYMCVYIYIFNCGGWCKIVHLQTAMRRG